jgi:hypothetical protein
LTASRGLKILVGHSYGGAVITQAASGDPDVKALVYVRRLRPRQQRGPQRSGQRARRASDRVPVQSNQPDGTTRTDIYLDPSYSRPRFAGDLPRRVAADLAATQPPTSAATFASKLTVEPAWKTIAAYRGGLDLDALGPSRRSDRLEGAAMRQALLAALEANEACGHPLPVQVHTGFGDSDLFLPRDQPRTHPMPRDPELYLLAATWWRDALAAMGPEALPAAAAEDAARMILRENALALYRLSASGRCGVSRTDTHCERMGHFAAEPPGHDGKEPREDVAGQRALCDR